MARVLADAFGLDVDVEQLDLGFRLTRLARLMALAVEDVASSLGLTTAEAVVLTALAAAGPDHVLSPTALHGMVVQTPGGITKTLRRLEHAVLVERRADPQDRRSLAVVLTDEGVARAREVVEASAQYYAGLFGEFDSDDLVDFSNAAGHLLSDLEQRLGFNATGRARSRRA